jgi:hypothetical protein
VGVNVLREKGNSIHYNLTLCDSFNTRGRKRVYKCANGWLIFLHIPIFHNNNNKAMMTKPLRYYN